MSDVISSVAGFDERVTCVCRT